MYGIWSELYKLNLEITSAMLVFPIRDIVAGDAYPVVLPPADIDHLMDVPWLRASETGPGPHAIRVRDGHRVGVELWF